MRWVSTSDLERWADSQVSRLDFAHLIGRLICASATNISSFRFPSGDGGDLPGFDGHLIAKGGMFVPDGESIWEFGTGQDYKEKAEADYEKRKEQVTPELAAKVTFVFATLQKWARPKTTLHDWVQQKKSENYWKDVRFYDAVSIEKWLEDSPAVAATFARNDLKKLPETGIRGLSQFWEEYSKRTEPPITEQMLLCDRSEQADQIISDLSNPTGVILLAADSTEEALAFVVAAIRKSDKRFADYFASRLLILDTEDAVRAFAHWKNMIFLVGGQHSSLAGSLADTSLIVVAHGKDRAQGNYIVLPRQSSSALGRALEDGGFVGKDGYEFARQYGRSVTILARKRARAGARKPEWIDSGQRLIPALLAGAWDRHYDKDIALIAKLSGEEYYAYEEKLHPFIKLADSPVDREGAVWSIRAPVDAFVYLGSLVNPGHIERLAAAIRTVFSRDELEEEGSTFIDMSERRTKIYSSWLRDGLANTLLQIAVLGEQADLNLPKFHGQAFVNELISSLPGLSENHRLIESLGRQLPMLMEAAPGPLLQALELLLEGDGSKIRPIMEERDGWLTPIGRHTELLWALERIAWDESYFLKAIIILTKLAALDPGGKLGNRPINSLRAILLPWHPQTHAGLPLRQTALNKIVQVDAQVGWSLIAELLPKGHDSVLNTPRLSLREGIGAKEHALTNQDVFKFYDQIIEFAVRLSGSNSERWETLISVVGSVNPIHRRRISEGLREHFDGLPKENRRDLWGVLQEEINRNLKFGDQDWALSKEDLHDFMLILEEFKPESSVDRYLWLFNDWLPDVPEAKDDPRPAIEKRRKEALEDIVSQFGPMGIVELGLAAKLPFHVAGTFISLADRFDDIAAVLESLLARNDQTFLIPLIAGAYHRFTDEVTKFVAEVYSAKRINNDVLVKILVTLPDDREIWNFAGKFGPELDELYWRQKSFWFNSDSREDIVYAIERAIASRRSYAAIRLAHDKSNVLETSLLLKILDGVFHDLAADASKVDSMASYYVSKLLGAIERRDDVDIRNVAQIEYALLPLIDNDKRPLALHKMMATYPSFFVDVIKDVFKESSALPREPTEENRAKAKAGFSLLMSFRTVPGSREDKTIDLEQLRDWCNGAIALGAASDRKIITEQYVGHILAYAPSDSGDNEWPCKEVRILIEELESDEVERGLEVERHNMRGVYSKSPYEGGKQERALADVARRASVTSNQYPRTSAMLKRIAEDWEREASREDERAELMKMKD